MVPSGGWFFLTAVGTVARYIFVCVLTRGRVYHAGGKKMQFTRRQRLILVGVLKDQQALINLSIGLDTGLPCDQLGRRRLAVRDAQAGYVPMNLTGWLGHIPTNSEFVLACRAYAKLEDMGLLGRHNFYGGRRTSHLRLTPAGRWIAEQLAEEDAFDTGEPLDLDNLEFMPIELPELAVAEIVVETTVEEAESMASTTAP
jgi:hypothetical protein